MKPNNNEYIASTLDEFIQNLIFLQEKCKIGHYNIYFNGYYITDKITISENDKSIELNGFPVINEEID